MYVTVIGMGYIQLVRPNLESEWDNMSHSWIVCGPDSGLHRAELDSVLILSPLYGQHQMYVHYDTSGAAFCCPLIMPGLPASGWE